MRSPVLLAPALVRVVLGSTALVISACTPPELRDGDGDGFTPLAGDCDDESPLIAPGRNDQVGDAVDQNCDGLDGVDGDGDGFASTASGGTDCVDLDSARNPGVVDRVGDGIDQNCDGADGVDADADGYAAESSGGQDCDDADNQTYPGRGDRTGDDIDRNCDGTDGVDADGDGAAGTDSGGLDCDDANVDIGPQVDDQLGDGEDQNCDGADGVDADGDGVASPLSGGDDCDDTNASVRPGTPDVCDALDNDCNPSTNPTGTRLMRGGTLVQTGSYANNLLSALDGDVIEVCGSVDGRGSTVEGSVDVVGISIPDWEPQIRCGLDNPGGDLPATPRQNCSVKLGDVTFRNLRLQGGGGRRFDARWRGGILSIEEAAGRVLLDAVVLSSGRADEGSLIWVAPSTTARLEVVDSWLELGDTELSGGGAVHLETVGPHTFTNSTFSNNDGFYGGAMTIDVGDVTLTDVAFLDNSGACGGAVDFTVAPGNSLTITRGKFWRNEGTGSSTGCSGALMTRLANGASVGDSTLTLVDVDFGAGARDNIRKGFLSDLGEAEAGARGDLGANTNLVCTPGAGDCLD